MTALYNDLLKSNFLRFSKKDQYSYVGLTKRVYKECKLVIFPLILINFLIFVFSISTDVALNVIGVNYWFATLIRLVISIFSIIYFQAYKDDVLKVFEILFLLGSCFCPYISIPLLVYVIYKNFILEIIYDWITFQILKENCN